MRIEFFESHNGVEVKGSREIVRLNGEYVSWAEFAADHNRLRILYEFLMDRPQIREIFKRMGNDGIIGMEAKIRQFKRCNLDALDSVIDVDTDLNYFNPEYVNRCGHKGANRHCPHAGDAGDKKPYCIIRNKYQIPIKK